MLSPYMFEQIRSLKNQGISQAEISRQLGVDPKTVAKYVRSNSPPRYKQRDKSTRVDEFFGFEDKVLSWIARTPTLTAIEVYELLLVEGYKGSERTINRRLKKLLPPESKERFFQQEYEPGEQAQFDFKEKVELLFVDGPRIIHLHFSTLPHSDACFIKAFPNKNYECFIDGLDSFFREIGGLPRNIRFDNLSPCVKKVLKGSERIYTDSFKKAIFHYGFGTLPCRPAKGSDKGDVERDIRTMISRISNRIAHEQMKFKNFDELNAWLKAFTTSRRTEEKNALFDEEKKKLLPLPEYEENVLFQMHQGSVSSHGSVRISRSLYSVPDTWIGKQCDILIGAYDVRVRNRQSKECVIHPRKNYGEDSILLEHVLPSLVRKPQAMVRWSHRSILFPSIICEKYFARLQKIDSSSAEREYLRSMNLVLQISLSELMTGMDLILETSSEKLFEDLKDLLFVERRPKNVIEVNFAYGLKPINPELSKYDALIPKVGQK